MFVKSLYVFHYFHSKGGTDPSCKKALGFKVGDTIVAGVNLR